MIFTNAGEPSLVQSRRSTSWPRHQKSSKIIKNHQIDSKSQSFPKFLDAADAGSIWKFVPLSLSPSHHLRALDVMMSGGARVGQGRERLPQRHAAGSGNMRHVASCGNNGKSTMSTENKELFHGVSLAPFEL